jgi:ribose/xylose/arabinose/galactoside ABC-type transport system permease subunit
MSTSDLVRPARQRGAAILRFRGVKALSHGVVIASFAAVVAYGAVTTQGFLSLANGRAILASVALVGIVAIGMTLIVLSGNFFSLSLGTTAAVGAIFFLYALRHGLAVAIVATLLLGLIIGMIQGAVIGTWGANPIIVTIAAAAILEGLVIWMTAGRSVLPPPGASAHRTLAQPMFGLPFGLYVLIAVALLTELMLRRTRLGREIYLVGESKRAARAAALGVPRVTIIVFAAAGVLSAVAGVLIGSGSGRGELLLGGTFTYDAFAAVIVGGNLITGGRGSIARTMVGALVIATISDILLLRGYSSGAQILVKGLIVLVVVVLVHLNMTRGTR